MIEFESFEFHGARFYTEKTVIPLNQCGLTYFKGQNLDGVPEGSVGKKVTTSNGTGKTWLVQLLEGFIFGRNVRGQFKKSVTSDFEGTLKFKDKHGISWSFTWEPAKSKDAWTILKDGKDVFISHKPSDCQAYLLRVLGITRDEWHYFVHLDQQSLNILMRGKPTERRVYLEGFFAIDAFYTQMFDEYNAKLSGLKEKLELSKDVKRRYEDVVASLTSYAGEQWVRIQQEACDDAISILKEYSTLSKKDRDVYAAQIDGWRQYHSLYTELQGLDVDQLKSEKQSLVEQKVQIDERLKAKATLQHAVTTKLKPHLAKKPQAVLVEPDQAAPDASEITEKEVRLSKMREKLRIKKKLNTLIERTNELKDAVATFIYNGMADSELDKLKFAMYKERTDAEKHLELLSSGGDVCPTCNQSLGFILGQMTLDEKKVVLQNNIKDFKARAKDIMKLQELRSQLKSIQLEYDTINEQFSQYPMFGVKLTDAEAELQSLKRLVSVWDQYQAEQKKIADWKAKETVIMAEVTALGYPQLLEQEDDTDKVSDIVVRVSNLDLDIRRFNKLEDLTSLVIDWKKLPDLEALLSTTDEIIAEYSLRIEALTELKGSFKEQLLTIVDLKAKESQLKRQVEQSSSLESEYRLLDIISRFYSSKGFKVYELKRRCLSLIERTNFWSKLFFQEPYEWSLSDDVDNLEFFIQPINDRTTEPYPVASLSSGESNRASRALLFSQLELIPPKKKLNVLFLDEIEGHLDEAGIVAFTDEVLPILKENFNDRAIVLISHQNSIPNSGVVDHMWVSTRKRRQTNFKTFPWYQRRRQQV